MAITLTLPPLLPKQAQARDLMRSGAKYINLEGGAQSAKTHTAIAEVAWRAMASPGTQHLIARKTQRAASEKIWKDFVRYVKGSKLPCRVYSKPDRAVFTNGSEVLVGGLAPGEIDNLLGSRYNTILIDEASEVIYRVFNTLKTRLNGIGVGRYANPIMVLTQNPLTEEHWIYKVFHLLQDPIDGNALVDAHLYKRMHFTPRDNLRFIAPDFLAMLEGLPEFERIRFLDGKYGQASNIVFPEFDAKIHVRKLTDAERSHNGRKVFVGFDFGYNHPTTAIWGYLADDGKMIITAEYGRNKAAAYLCAQDIFAIERTNQALHYTRVSDHQIEYRLAFAREGLATMPAHKDTHENTNALRSLFGRGTIVIDESCKNLISQLRTYRWKEGAHTGLALAGDKVVKDNDDYVDALLYLVSRAVVNTMKEIA
jgi:PBSX family phage terminase large subunit